MLFYSSSVPVILLDGRPRPHVHMRIILFHVFSDPVSHQRDATGAFLAPDHITMQLNSTQVTVSLYV